MSVGVQNLIERIEKFNQILSDPDLTFMKNFQERALELKEKIQRSDVLIPLIGEFSSGKSSLINALLGRELLPVDVTPTTAVVNEIRFSSKEDFIEVIYRDGRIERISFSSDLRGFNNADVKLIRIYSSLNLISPNIVIVDTPGLSSLIKEHEETIKEYVPKSDAIFLVIDVNQGTLTRSSVAFLEYTNLINRKIYAILTKSDTKSEKELNEVREYLRNNYPIIAGVFVTSSKSKKLDEFYSLLNQISRETSEILANSVIREFSKTCTATCDFLKEHFNNLSFDPKDLDIKIKEMDDAVFALEKELTAKLDNLRKGIDDAKFLAIDEFSRLLDSRLDYLADVYFSDPDGFQDKFDETIRNSAEQVVHIFSRTIKVKLENFEMEIRDFQFSDSVSTTVSTAMKGVNEIVMIVLLDLVIPGGILYALVGGILLKILSKIPRIGGAAGVYGKIISQLVSKIGQIVSKGFVKNELRKAITNAIDEFSTYIETETRLLLEELENRIKKELSSAIATQRESLNKLKEEKREKKETFEKYKEKIKSIIAELESFCME